MVDPRKLLAVALVLIAGCGSAGPGPAPTPNFSACHTSSGSPSGLDVAPDRSCTPGAWIDATGAGVCHKGYNPRPPLSVTAKLKRQAMKEYGLPYSLAPTVESDHLYPVWLGGATVLANLWPEPNYPSAQQTKYVHNPKDALEFAIYKLTCRHAPVQPKLTVAQARKVFEGDWRSAYRRYVGPLP